MTQHIDSRPDKCGGKPCIAGTRVRVLDVYVWHELEGLSPDEIVLNFPELSLMQVHAALTYYYGHRQEIQDSFEAEKTLSEEVKSKHTSKLLGKLSGKDARGSAILP